MLSLLLVLSPSHRFQWPLENCLLQTLVFLWFYLIHPWLVPNRKLRKVVKRSHAEIAWIIESAVGSKPKLTPFLACWGLGSLKNQRCSPPAPLWAFRAMVQPRCTPTQRATWSGCFPMPAAFTTTLAPKRIPVYLPYWALSRIKRQESCYRDARKLASRWSNRHKGETQFVIH